MISRFRALSKIRQALLRRRGGKFWTDNDLTRASAGENPKRSFAARFAADPRAGQIAALSSFAILGATLFAIDIQPLTVAVVVAAALATQAAGGALIGLRFDPLSALITSLSLTLLLRTSDPALAALAAALAIGSKMALRWGGGHVFNPANFGLCIVAYVFSGAWISPGQWGSGALLLVAFAVAGLAVSGRAGRLDSAVAFLLAWAAVVFGRAAWLGDPWAIPIHQMQSGSLLLFAFFMITDPMTTPRRAAARVLHAAVVAIVAGILTFWFYEPLGVIYALFLCAPLTPLLNWAAPGRAYLWHNRSPYHA